MKRKTERYLLGRSQKQPNDRREHHIVIPARFVRPEEVRVTQSRTQDVSVDAVPVQLARKVEIRQFRVVVVLIPSLHLRIDDELTQTIQIDVTPLVQHRRDDHHSTGVLTNIIGQQFGEQEMAQMICREGQLKAVGRCLISLDDHSRIVDQTIEFRVQSADLGCKRFDRLERGQIQLNGNL